MPRDWNGCATNARNVPLLHGDADPATTLAKLDAIRTPLYQSLADFEVDTSGMNVDEVVDHLMAMLKQHEAAA